MDERHPSSAAPPFSHRHHPHTTSILAANPSPSQPFTDHLTPAPHTAITKPLVNHAPIQSQSSYPYPNPACHDKMKTRRPVNRPSTEPAFLPPAPLLRTRTQRKATNPARIYASSSLDDDFFLPSDARPDRRQNPATSKTPISFQRLQQKGIEIANAALEKDDDELRRSQLVDEQLSAADLFGGDTADILKGVDINSQSSLPNPFEPHAQPASPTPAPSATASAKTRKKPRATNTVPLHPHPATHAAEPQPVDGAEPGAVARPPSLSAIKIGSFINHQRHGIGRFLGLERTRGSTDATSPIVQEYAVLEYRDGDVFVPLSQFDMIQPMAPEEARAIKRLDKIAGTPGSGNPSAVLRTRRANYLARGKTRSKIRQQLVNLHGLYAERTTISRPPIPADLIEEARFSARCSFVLTGDQANATSQILADMTEQPRPMDRLLCGDVGFGKTEVAIRAAFRALRAGKQVAVLAPTTILAQQHYETFKDRLAEAYPEYRIAIFNRFVARKTLQMQRSDVQSGDIQVAIGTHMLLSDRISFCNLGFLIIDEEHRFGVNQKEKMRARYRQVDTLFLSATPIPRTLHLALSGLRDASVLRTAPVGRKPIVTKMAPTGSGIVREAIRREVERGGQVFFVVPRIEGIEATANWISDLFVDDSVLVTVAHGQSSDLERRIWSFAQREFDVLVCTTIIENGIHMPAVNTIIIQDAGKFGLAQLHQLRGRVGRSEAQAYAFVLYTVQCAANMATMRRLKALEANSELGSGFAIAQRDMEMRGVGTILGVEQHGNNSVGTEEYAKMLSEELEHARTGEPIPMSLPEIDTVEILLPVPSLIPDDYISDFEDKMGMYKQLSDCKTTAELAKVVVQMEKRYGKIPSETCRHICLLEVKLYAKDIGIRKMMTERQHVVMEWAVEAAVFNRLVAFLPDKLSRDRCEHIEADERVVIRGLGICSGDIQLAKVRKILACFRKAADGFLRDRKTTGCEATLSDALMVLTDSVGN